ncbi:MAG: hypothetical protein R3C14_02030 [Caldilineaceae bacterium]
MQETSAQLHISTADDDGEAQDVADLEAAEVDTTEPAAANPARPVAFTNADAEDQIDDEFIDYAGMNNRSGPRRLITGVQGLLTPLRLTSVLVDDDEFSQPLVAPPLQLEAEQWRRLRTQLAEDPVLLDLTAMTTAGAPAPLAPMAWLMFMVGLIIALPIFVGLPTPVGTPQQWPGVTAAHAAIDALPAEAEVWIYWAYDPATAGEMDLLALPLARHLLERQTHPILISPLPGGPAVAQRLFDRAISDLRTENSLEPLAGRALYWNGGYLPGGAAVLAWLAQSPAAALYGHTQPFPMAWSPTQQPQSTPALTVVVAATAEAVQQWLEQVQPLLYRPVVAFTTASADPLLRPYLDSGQLSGLVSGFDGAAFYTQLQNRPLPYAEEQLGREQLIFQNWGHLALLGVIVLGNLAVILRRRSGG